MVISRGYWPHLLRAADIYADQTVISPNADATPWQTASRSQASGMRRWTRMRVPTHPYQADRCRVLFTFAGLIVLHLALLGTMRRRIGSEPPNPADLLTGARV